MYFPQKNVKAWQGACRLLVSYTWRLDRDKKAVCLKLFRLEKPEGSAYRFP